MATTKEMSLALFGLYGLWLGQFLARRFGNWNWFSYHVASMIVSFVSLSTAGVMLRKRLGKQNTILHGQVMALATAVAGFGYYVIFSNKEMLEKPHLTSWHAWCGMAALVAYVSLFVIGLGGLHPDFGVLRTSRFVKISHKYFGRVGIAAGWTACILGFNKLDTDPTHQVAFLAPLALAAIFVLR